ncbi:MAG: hypothetical protein IPN04_11665 [Rhodoferax sp.]|nr:hypothetical protein [Rhodoferax sp.]
MNYQVCAPAPSTTVCDTAILNVTAGAADMSVTQPATPIVSAPGSTVNTSITCTASNVAPNSTAIAPTCGATAVDSTGASVPVTIGTCTPALPLGTLAAGATIVCPVSYVTPGHRRWHRHHPRFSDVDRHHQCDQR